MLKEMVYYRHEVPIAIHVMELEEYPIHYHDAFELIYVLDGSVTVKDGYDRTIIRKGDIWFVESGDLHSFSTTDEGSQLLIMNFDFQYFEKYFPGLRKMFFPSIVSETDDYLKEANIRLKEQIAQLAYGMINSQVMMEGTLEDVAIELIRNLINNFQYFRMNDGKLINNPAQKENVGRGRRINRIMTYIFDEYNQNISLENIAQREHLNPNYLSHIIKETTNMGFKDLLSMVRVENSEKLLLDTNKRISEIALECGFSAVRYYEKAFIQWYGMSPAQYRDEQLNCRELIDPEKNKVIYNPQMIQEILAEKLLLQSSKEQILSTSKVKISADTIAGLAKKDGSKLYESLLENSLYISNPTSILMGNTENVISTMKHEFKLQVIEIDVDFLVKNEGLREEQKLEAYISLVRAVNAIIDEDMVPAFIFDSIDEKMLRAVENFFCFYTERFRENAKQLLFMNRSRRKDREKDNRMIVKRLSEATGIAPNTRNSKGVKPRKTYAACIYDSYLMSAFAVDEMLNNQNWNSELLCSVVDPIRADGHTFEGGCSLVTWNGIKKPWYYAYMLLDQMGGYVVERQKNYIIVSNDTQIFIMTYHLAGYSQEILAKIKDRNDLRNIINGTATKKMHTFQLTGFDGEYRIIRQKIGKDTCMFSKWEALKFGAFLTAYEEKTIESQSIPKTSIFRTNIKDDFELISDLNPFEIELITVEKIDYGT